MKSTRPGVFEYQVAAVARFTFLANGARFDGYNPIAGGGTNAWMGHYSRNLDALNDGDMVLMDYAPDLRYYTSDVTRMWPVNGRYSEAQRTLARFILEYRQAFFRYIRPGVTPDDVLVRARKDMEGVLAKTRFAREGHRKAAEEMLTFRGHLQHPVGMTVHDPGVIWGKPFQAGVVFTVDPMMWIPDEKLYVRMEDTIVVTTRRHGELHARPRQHARGDRGGDAAGRDPDARAAPALRTRRRVRGPAGAALMVAVRRTAPPSARTGSGRARPAPASPARQSGTR